MLSQAKEMLITSENKRTLQLAIPIIVANLVQVLMGIIDSAMVGAINSDLLAASSLVVNVISIPYILCIGLTLAVATLISSALGASQTASMTAILKNALLLNGLFALAIALIIQIVSFVVHHMGQDAIVAELAQPYLEIMGWSIIPMILFLTLKQFSDGLEETKWPMYISLATIPANIILNYILIYGKLGFPRMELVGAGIGTLLTRVFMLIAMAILIVKSPKFKAYVNTVYEKWQPQWATMKSLLRIGIPTSMQYAMESWAFSVSGIMIGWLGALQQASHQIALSLASFTFMVSLGLSAAGSIRVSNAKGRRDLLQLRQIGKGTLKMAIIYGVVCGLIFIIFRHQLPWIFNDEAPVIAVAAHLLILAAIFQISDSTQAIGVGLLRGIHDVKVPTLFVTIAYWVIGIPAGYLLAFPLGLEATGIWIGLVFGLTVSAIMLNIRFFRLTKQQLIRANNH